MAEHADGSIIVDTEIDAQGFKAGSSELQGAIKSLNTKIQSLGPTFQKALSGNASAIATFDAKAAALESTISDIEEKMESLAYKKVPTEDYQWLTSEIEKANNELSKLYDRQAKMEATGVKQNSSAWQSLQYNIDLAKRKISEYEAEQASMEANGAAFQMGSSTAEYSQLSSALASAKDRLAEMRAEVDSAGQSTSRLSRIASGVKSALANVGKVGAEGFKTLVSGVKNGISKLRSLRKESGNSGNAITKLAKKITGLGSILKRMAIRQIMSGITSGVKDGFNNLSQYSAQTNSDLSTLKSALTQLKNSFATAFAPILTAVTPALTTLINYLSSAITYVGKFVAALTGAKTFTKATAVQEDYASSLGDTSSAAKEAKKQLAGFDELNVLSDSSSSDSSGSSTSPSEMFEEVPIESSITDFVDRLKAAFKDGDYAEIGEIIGNGINTAFQKINDFISWDNVGGTVTKIVSGIAKDFNSLIYTVDWELIGDTVAQGFNTVLHTLYLIITEFDWPALAAALAQSLNGLVSGIDWGLLGTTLSTGFITAIKSIRSAITTFDWVSLGKDVADAVNNIDWVGILSDLAGGISDILIAALDLLIGFADNLDWGKLGRDLWNGLIGVITNINWSGIISKAFHLLGSAVGGCAKLIVEFCDELWNSLKQGFEDTKEYFNTYIEEAGGNIVEGIWNGIVDALKNVGNWIVENIWDPFIEGFKNAFGIHSPSTKMAEMGDYIIEGLLNGIKNTWSSITSFFSNSLSSVKETIGTAWGNIKQGASTAWSGIKNTVSNAWDGIKSGASNACTAVKNGVSTAWTNVKDAVSTKLDAAKAAASTAWNSIKSTASTVGSNVASAASTAWANVKNTVSNNLNNAKTLASTAWESMKSNASTINTGVKSAVSNAWSGIKSLVTGNLDGAKSSANAAWDSIKSTASTVSTNIKATVSNAWSNMKTSISDKLSGIKSSVSNTFTNLKNSSSTWGKDLVDNMASGISNAKSTIENAVKGVADKIKSFLGFSEPEDGPLSNFHTYMPDMIDLMTEGIKDNQDKAIEAVSDMASAISGEIQDGDYAMGDVETGKMDSALTGFSDKVANSFSTLLERLQAIADGVTFTVPAVATGTVVPYSVSASTANDSNVTGAIEASNEELGSVVIQAVTNATTAIVAAIEANSGTVVNLDANSIATSTIKEINRRTRAMGKSPLVTT